MNPHFIDRLGGTSRCMTLFTFGLHFLHSFLSLVNYLLWVRTPESRLGGEVQVAYLSLVIVSCLFYYFGASVFYMWAWRFPEPEEVAMRHRVYGVLIHLIFSDLPIFILETLIVAKVHIPAAIVGVNYALTCTSFFYSALRVWFFFLVRCIKFHWSSVVPIDINYATRGVATAQRDLDIVGYPGLGTSSRYSGGGVAPPFAEAGNTIVLNGNAGLYSDDTASATGLHSTPTTDRAYRDGYYNVSSGLHSTPSLSFGTPHDTNQGGHRRVIRPIASSARRSTPPSRI